MDSCEDILNFGKSFSGLSNPFFLFVNAWIYFQQDQPGREAGRGAESNLGYGSKGCPSTKSPTHGLQIWEGVLKKKEKLSSEPIPRTEFFVNVFCSSTLDLVQRGS